MLRFAVIAILSCCANMAFAQSEEQTVALIVSGLAPGVATGNLCGEVGMPQLVSASPARYRFVCKQGGAVEVVFRKLDNCRYETFDTEAGKASSPAATLDFRKFQALLPENPAFKTSHFFRAEPDFCTDKGACLALFVSLDNGQCCSFPANIPWQRRESAIASLFANFCRKDAR